MKIYYGLMSLLILCACSQNQETGELVTGEDGWINLLDDELSAWNTYGRVEASMDEGVLTFSAIDGSPSALIATKHQFDNFHLSFEIKNIDTQSFILFRFNDKIKTTPEQAGYVLSTDATQDLLNPIGTVLSVVRSTLPEGYDANQWNTIEVQAVNKLLTVHINGKRVAVVNDERFSSGAIAIQVPSVTGKEVQYKNFRIQQLATIQVVEELLENRYRGDTAKPWETLFNGKSLEGWNPTGDGTWSVENEVIHGYSGAEGGFLVSEKAYKDFYLKTLFKIKKEDNSGIFIRKSPDSTTVTTTDAIECNIYDHNGPSHAYSTGSIATHARAWFGMINYDDWNEMEIFAEDDHIVMFVNGRKSSESYLPNKFNKSGNICLQGGIKVFAEDRGPSDIYFKDIMLKSFD